MTDRPVVLVVEDDVEMNELQRELLCVHGMDSLAAYDGCEALDILERKQPDAVLLDLMLPRMDGIETCTLLRESKGARLPVVMITALDSEDMRRRGYEAGADAYFAKPFDPDEVIGAIQMLIEQASGDENERR